MPAAPGPTTAAHTGQADLTSLAAELTTRGYRTILRTPDSAEPCLHVVNPLLAASTHSRPAQPSRSWLAKSAVA
ncbi:MAG: hypothetical protein ACRDNF_20835 [Streptosporangiaceae bacterium]